MVQVSAFCGAWLTCSDLDEQGHSLGPQGTGIMKLGETDKTDDPKKIIDWEDQRMTNGRREKY